jgi:2-oxoisovalerate dehydrogenase E1 component alpha subunit
MTKLTEFAISSTRIVDPSGRAVSELPAFARGTNGLKALYRAMVLTRAFDAKAIALQRTGRNRQGAGVLMTLEQRPDHCMPF